MRRRDHLRVVPAAPPAAEAPSCVGKPHDPAVRGHVIVYRDGEVNHCPGCGRSHWHIGRMTAECGFCGTALPLRDSSAVSARSAERRPE